MTLLTTCGAQGVHAAAGGGGISGPVTTAAGGQAARRDLYYGGGGNISGLLLVEDPVGTPERPIRRRVLLVDRRSDLEIQQTISDPATGAFAFTRLRTDLAFRIEADDYTATYNAVVADWVYAE